MTYNQTIINAGKTFAVAMTGGGTDAIPSLLRYGGMSKVFLGAEVPYSEDSLNEITDHKYHGDKAVSQNVATTLASYMWSKYNANFGVGVTSSLYYEGQREERVNQAYLSIVTIEEDYHNHLVFNSLSTSILNGLDTNLSHRTVQEELLSKFIVANIIFFLCKRIDMTDDFLYEFKYDIKGFCDTSKLHPDFLKALNV